MNPKMIYNSYSTACKIPFGAVPDGQMVHFTLRFPKDFPLLGAALCIFPMDVPSAAQQIGLQWERSDFDANYYSCTFTPEQPQLLAYDFIIWQQHGTLELKKGEENQSVLEGGNPWQLTVYDRKMQPPKAMLGGMVYQIFPDRFCCSGDTKPDVPSDRTLRSDWGALPEWRPNSNGEITNSDYFCGDLRGIVQKLDYLADLGTTVIYLNPVFESHSSHRYDTANYEKIDPLLGSEDDFRELCEQAKVRGIAIVLDGVFSHTGSDSIYFNREKRYGSGGAYNDPQSCYRPWYKFINYPQEYECWWNFPTLPNVNETEPGYLDYICGEQGILHKWMDLGAIGYRLDVADELPDEFLDRLHQSVKAKNPDAPVIGEVWEDASNKMAYGYRRRYLLGRQLDSVMNYPFKDAVLSYIRDGSAKYLYQTLMQIVENYPPPVLAVLMNSLSTHDTPRAITLLVGEPMQNNREWQAEHHFLPMEQYQRGKQMLLLATLLQFGLPGIPCVYYGDEAGLSGYRDPFNRMCYPWGHEDAELVDAVRALGNFRKAHPAIAQAEFFPILVDESLCIFLRRAEKERFWFVVNRSAEEHLLPEELAGKQMLFLTGNCEGNRLAALSGVLYYENIPEKEQ